ncbi:MAG: chromosome segregation protein SMC [Anaerolineaceae bacterium]|jgi:chromosome segregation protein
MISRLKSLELQGYKTFASRMMFEFPATITAIVGPNGAGKSNVADALRWVLGEQSYSLLRGRKTEDMIFAGSEHRPRASMASATITFDNEDGWLPIDFSEVSITRRAYRDGQNEYLLNGQRVRLKEISELLAKSGLAERTYTIIGQGLVDAALSLKPDERRRFFEEAAGIGLYRSRREEALNRLESTRRNLERVLDILSELEPRLRSLERQARRAAEYERVKADLQLILKDWYGFHWHRSQKEVARARDIYQTQEHRLEQARSHLIEAEKKVTSSRAMLQEVRSSLNQWHGQQAEFHRKREHTSRNLAVLDERQKALLEQEHQLQAEFGRLDEEYASGQERLSATLAMLARLNADLAEAQGQVESARQSLASRQAEREQAEQSLQAARQRLDDAQTRQVQLRAHENELTIRLSALRQTQQTLKSAEEKDAETLRQQEGRFTAAAAERSRVEAAVKQAEEDLLTMQRQIAEIEINRRRLQAERAEIDAMHAKARAQLDVIEQAEKSLSGVNQGAQFLLEAASKAKLPGGYRLFIRLMEVPATYEAAVAAVLGETLDSVFLDHQADIEHALSLLENSDNGRTILLAQDLVQAGERIAAPQAEGVIGLAADLVHAPPELQPFVDLLLGQAVIVRNRAEARRLVNSIPPTARLVTLKGEVFWGSGVVIAGKEHRAGVISRPRQKRELQAQLDNLSRSAEQNDTAVRTLEQAYAAHRAKQTQLEKTLREAQQELKRAVQAHQQAGLQLEQIRQRIAWQRQQSALLGDQLQHAEQEQDAILETLNGIKDEVQKAQDELRQRNRALADLSPDEIQSQVNYWNTQFAVTTRAIKDAENRLDEYRQSANSNRQRHAQTGARIHEVALLLEQLNAEKAERREQEGLLSQQIEALQQEIQPAEARLNALESEYARLQANQTAAQQAVSVAERYASQAQLELTRQREALETLRRRIEDDFGLVVFEYASQVSGPTPLPFGDMVKELPVKESIAHDLEENINRQRGLLRRMGAVNPEAQAEYEGVLERYHFLKSQVEDLRQADLDLRQVIAELDELMQQEFRKTFDAVAVEFKGMFTRLFNGGSARLVMDDEDNLIETGIDIEARLPGRREHGLALLSGGERSLTAVALIFSLLKVSPTPFCVLDEVDAMLDEANVGRFCELLQELSLRTQFLLITHNRNTVQTAGVIYGVTMGRDSASQIISLKLDEVDEEMAH